MSDEPNREAPPRRDPFARVTSDELSAAIQVVTAAFIGKPRIVTARDIGSGYCYEFAKAVFGHLGAGRDYIYGEGPSGLTTLETDSFWEDDFSADLGAWRQAGEIIPDDLPEDRLIDLLGGATHQWIVLNGRHYDATASGGVTKILDLPFFADQIEGMRQELASRGPGPR